MKGGEIMPSLEDLKKNISSGKAKEPPSRNKEKSADELAGGSTDMAQVEKIVETMKKKYSAQGVEFEAVSGKLGELRGAIASADYSKIQVQGAEELAEFKSPIVKRLGKLYLVFKIPVDAIIRLVRGFSFSKELAYQLYSANMKYSVQQYLVLAIVLSALGFFSSMLFSVFLAIFFEFNFVFATLFSFILAFFLFIVILIIPKSRARVRADDLSTELPFALRHMSTELKSGIGLYKTLQAIATADYGVLSEEFSRTINEIEEGTDAKDALRHFALRTQCKALRSALFQMVRALKTGGNLSGTMNQIAEDVSFELGMKIRDFGEKMNFFGVLFIVFGIVMPVFVAILGAISNIPFGIKMFSLNPLFILLFYAILMPFVLVLLVFYLKIIEPKV